jgi:hypothetical protein
MSPTWDLSGSFLKRRMDTVYFNQVSKTAVDRENAEYEYRERVTELTSR